MTISPGRRAEICRQAALTRWARTVNRTEQTAAARDALYASYLPADFDSITDGMMRQRLTDAARKAHAAKMRAAKAAKRQASAR